MLHNDNIPSYPTRQFLTLSPAGIAPHLTCAADTQWELMHCIMDHTLHIVRRIEKVFIGIFLAVFQGAPKDD